MSNLSQVRNAKQRSEKKLFGLALDAYTKGQTDEAEKIFKTEDMLHKYLDEWNTSQRNALETRKASIEVQSHVAENTTFILFTIGWLITIVDKLSWISVIRHFRLEGLLQVLASWWSRLPGKSLWVTRNAS